MHRSPTEPHSIHHSNDQKAFDRYEAFERLSETAQRHNNGLCALDQVRQAAQRLVDLGDLDGFGEQLILDIDRFNQTAQQEAA